MTFSTKRGREKRALVVRIRADLLAAARDAGLDLSATLERALAEELSLDRCCSWRVANEAGIAAYNDSVVRDGVFSDGRRMF